MTVISEQGSDLQNISRNLETIFEKIYRERMADMPVINNKIGVHAIGFRYWGEELYLGVMITPWFMNLTLLPNDSESWNDKLVLSTSTYTFPSGSYKFLTAFEPGIGKYQTCSLFSPMFEFADDSAATETAEIILKELMNSEHIESGDIHSVQIEKIWSGEEIKPEALAEQPEEPEQATPTNKIERPISRRKLLRCSFMLVEEKNE